MNEFVVLGVDLGAEPARCVTIIKCARCWVNLDASVFGGDLDALADAHHAVCPGPARTITATGTPSDQREVAGWMSKHVTTSPAPPSNPYLGSQQQRSLEYLAAQLPPPVYFDLPLPGPFGCDDYKLPPGVHPVGVLRCGHGKQIQDGGPPPPDPLDAVIDGVTLRDLVNTDQRAQQADSRACATSRWTWTPAQRAAVSAHWSAQLRARVAASNVERKLREPSVVIGVDAEDLPWR